MQCRPQKTNATHRVWGLLLALTLLSGCALGKRQPPPDAKPAPPPDAEARLDQWLAHLTLEEKVGQLFWTGLPGSELTAEVAGLIQDGKVGGLVFFARQGSDPQQLRALTDSIQQAAQARERATPGVVISVDQEGGLVQRFDAPFTAWPGNMALGAAGSEALAQETAAAMAKEMRAVGIHLNLAPVADVNNNPENPVIGIRSFGEDPDLVAKMVQATIQGFQSEGLGSVAKHFPGHGDTDVDSHKGLPLIAHGRERLDRVELPPFRTAIAAGTDGIMSAHVIFPAVAKDGLPATLSPDVLTGLLREEMGYQGLVMTDALDGMKAITDNYGLEHGMIMALKAGTDVLLVPDSYEILPRLHSQVVQAVQQGEVSVQRLDMAVRQNLELKAKLGLLPALSQEAAQEQKEGKPLPAVVGSAEHQRLANRVGAQALTLVRNRHLPLRLDSGQQVLVIGPEYSASASGTEGAATQLGAGIKAHHSNMREILLPKDPSSEAQAVVQQAAEGASVIVYGVYNGHWYDGHQRLIRELIGTGKPVVVVGMGEPYELTSIPEIETYVAAYGYQPSNQSGVGGVLFGTVQPQGRLPVSIPNLYRIGHRLAY